MDEVMKLIAAKLQDKDERMRLARKILEDESRLTQTAFVNAGDGSAITLKQYLDEYGYENALNAVVRLLESFAQDGNANMKSYTSDEVNDALYRVSIGEGSEEDKAVAKMFEGSQYAEKLKEQNSQNMMHMFLHNMFQMIHFAVEDKHYTPLLADFTIMMELLLTETLMLTPSSALYRFKDTTNSAAINIGKQVADDMQKACMSTIWKDKSISPEYIIMGLLSWLNQIINTNEYEFVTAREMIEHMDIGDEIDLDDDSSGETEEKEEQTEVPGVAQPICHGSNNDKVVSFEDRAMKNLLKDD